MKLLLLVVELLRRGLEELDRFRRRREAQEAQESYDAIKKDPVAEFNERYGRELRSSATATSAPATEAPRSGVV